MDRGKAAIIEIKMFALMSILLPKEMSLGIGRAQKGLEMTLRSSVGYGLILSDHKRFMLSPRDDEKKTKKKQKKKTQKKKQQQQKSTITTKEKKKKKKMTIFQKMRLFKLSFCKYQKIHCFST